MNSTQPKSNSESVTTYRLFETPSLSVKSCLSNDLPIKEQKGISPSTRLFQHLMIKGIVDELGHLKFPMKSSSGRCVSHFNEKMSTFLTQPRKIKVKGMDIHLTISLDEVFRYLNRISPAISIEILKQHALYFLGFELIEQTFIEWGMDLKEICGTEFLKELKQKINKDPSYLLIHYFVETPDYNQVSRLKRGVVDFLAEKLPINTEDPKSAEYIQVQELVIQQLCQKKERHYSEWIQEFENLYVLIRNIVADELMIGSQIEPKSYSQNPFGSICLEFDHLAIELQFSHAIPSTSQRLSEDAIHVPVSATLNAEELQRYDCHLIQGLINEVCNNVTLLPFSSPLHEDWIKVLFSRVNGKTCRTPLFLNEVLPKVLEFASFLQRKKGNKSIGSILGEMIMFAWKKMQIELPEFALSNSKGLVPLILMAYSDLQESLSSEELKNCVETLIPLLEPILGKTQNSLFKTIAQGIKDHIPIPLITTYLEIGAYQLLSNKNLPHETALWLNQKGTNEQITERGEFDEIIQLQIDRKDPAFLEILKDPLKTGVKLLDFSFESNKHALFLNRLLSQMLSVESSAIQVSIPLCGNSLTTYINHLTHLLQKNKNKSQRIAYLDQFFELLNTLPFSLLKEIDALKKVCLANCSAKQATPWTIVQPILSHFGRSFDPYLNHAAYQAFKKQKSNSPQWIETAKALCVGSFPNATRVFIRVAKASSSQKKLLSELFELLCVNLKKQKQNNIVLQLDILLKEIEHLAESKIFFPSAPWLAEYVLRMGNVPLAFRLLNCIELNGQNQSLIKKINEAASEQTPGLQLAHNPYAQIHSSSEAILAVETITKKLTLSSFHELATFLQRKNILKIYEKDPDGFWTDLLVPALKKCASIPLADTYPLFIQCLQSCITHLPTAEAASEFLDQLNQAMQEITLTKSIPKPLKEALVKSQEIILNILIKYQLPMQLLDSITLWLKHKVHFSLGSIQPILMTMNHLLDETVNDTIKQKVHEGLNHAELKKYFSQEAHILLRGIYTKLCMTYFSESFELSFQYFQKAHHLANNPDKKLCILFMNRCAKENRVLEFATITKTIRKWDVDLQECWRKNFEHLFLNDTADCEIKNSLHALSHLLETPSLPKPMDSALSERLVQRLSKIETRSPYFNISLRCSLRLLELSTIKKELFKETYIRLKFSTDSKILEKAWDLLKLPLNLTQTDHDVCWKSLFEAIEKGKFPKIFEALTDPKLLLVFNLKHPKTMQVYAVLFDQLEKNWDEHGNQRVLEELKKIFEGLSKKSCFKSSTIQYQIKVAYARCLSTSTKSKDRTQSLKILYDCIHKDYIKNSNNKLMHSKHEFKKTIKKHLQISDKVMEIQWCDNSFESIEPLEHPIFPWNKIFSKAAKKILLTVELTDLELYELTELLLFHPNHEIGCLLLQKLTKHDASQSHLKHAGKLLFRLIETGTMVSSEEYLAFKSFCRSRAFNLKNCFQQMILFSDKSLNNLVLECLSLPKIQTLLDKEDRDNFRFHAFKNILNFCVLTRSFQKDLLNDIFQLLPHYLKERSKLEMDEFVNLLFDFIAYGYVFISTTGDLDHFYQVNEILSLWRVNPELSNDTVKVLDFDEKFYLLVQAVIRGLYSCEVLCPKLIHFFTKILLQGVQSPHNHHHLYLQSLQHFYFICKERNAQLSDGGETQSSAAMLELIEEEFRTMSGSKSDMEEWNTNFPSKVEELFTRLPQESHLSKLIKKCFSYLKIEKLPIIKSASFSVYEKKHEIISLIEELLKSSHSEPDLKIYLHIFKVHLQEMVISYGYSLVLIRSLTESIFKLDSVHSGTLFASVAEILFNFYQKMGNKVSFSKSQEFKFYTSAVIENYTAVIRSFTNCDLNHFKCLDLIVKFKNIMTYHHFILKKPQFNHFLHKGIEAYMKLCADCLNGNLGMPGSYEDIVKFPLDFFSLFVSDPKHKEAYFQRWINELLSIAMKMQDPKRMLYIIQELECTAIADKLYVNFQNLLDQFLKHSTECMDSQKIDEKRLGKIALSIIPVLLAFPQNLTHEEKLQFLNHWIEMLLKNGKTYNRMKIIIPLLQILVKQAQANHLYAQDKEMYKKHLMLANPQNK